MYLSTTRSTRTLSMNRIEAGAIAQFVIRLSLPNASERGSLSRFTTIQVILMLSWTAFTTRLCGAGTLSLILSRAVRD